MLALSVPYDHPNWDAALSFITFSPTSGSQRTIGVSPIYLLVGLEQDHPIDFLLAFLLAPILTEVTRDAT